MLEPALEWLKSLSDQAAELEIVEEYGNKYYVTRSGTLSRIMPDELFDPDKMEFNTLTGLADYVNANKDGYDLEKVMLVVNGPLSVTLETVINKSKENSRCVLAAASGPNCEFVFGDPRGDQYGGGDPWYKVLNFVIALQSQFVQSPMVQEIISHLSHLANEKIIEQKDDTFAQHLQVRTGITTKSEVKVVNPVTLAPFRTFREVDQPEADFILRFQEEKGSPEITCALFAADGGAWELAAMKSIKEFMKTNIQNEIPILC